MSTHTFPIKKFPQNQNVIFPAFTVIIFSSHGNIIIELSLGVLKTFLNATPMCRSSTPPCPSTLGDTSSSMHSIPHVDQPFSTRSELRLCYRFVRLSLSSPLETSRRGILLKHEITNALHRKAFQKVSFRERFGRFDQTLNLKNQKSLSLIQGIKNNNCHLTCPMEFTNTLIALPPRSRGGYFSHSPIYLPSPPSTMPHIHSHRSFPSSFPFRIPFLPFFDHFKFVLGSHFCDDLLCYDISPRFDQL